MWENWKRIKKGDYFYAKLPEHPRANNNGYVLEHHVVAENKIGRLLKNGECVHHINGNGKDNRPENLKVMSIAQHSREHNTVYPGGHKVVLVCDYCGDSFKREYRNRPQLKGYKGAYCSLKCFGKDKGFKSKP